MPDYTPTFVGPDLFNPPAHQGWITLTPSFTLSGEYNDNLFLSSSDRESDVVFGLTPGLTMSMQRAGYRVAAGYSTSGELYLENDELNDFGKRQQFFADVFYQVSPRVTFALTDRFLYRQSSNGLTSSGVSVGRQDAWRNTVVPRLRWQATPTTGFNLLASHTILRFDDENRDSDTYRVGLEMDRRLTPRLTGMLGAGVAFLDFKDEPDAWTYTPTLGFSYAITPTLRASVRGGASWIDRDGDSDSEITPAVAASLTQAFKFGSVGIGYDRAVTAETVGLSDRQTIFGSLVVPTLLRGLQVGFTPRYSIVDRDLAGTDISVKALTLTLRATYQLARSISLIGAYTFFHQTVDRSSGNLNTDIDQNRVFLGLQYAFPITIY